jgi:hypothetical protein
MRFFIQHPVSNTASPRKQYMFLIDSSVRGEASLLDSKDYRRRQELDFWAEASFPMLIVPSTDIFKYSMAK